MELSIHPPTKELYLSHEPTDRSAHAVARDPSRPQPGDGHRLRRSHHGSCSPGG